MALDARAVLAAADNAMTHNKLVRQMQVANSANSLTGATIGYYKQTDNQKKVEAISDIDNWLWIASALVAATTAATAFAVEFYIPLLLLPLFL